MAGTPALDRDRRVIAGIAQAARRLPSSRTKSRAGRVLGWLLPRLGADPVVVARTRHGAFVLDSRSRTEATMLWNGAYDDHDIAFLRAATPPDGTFLDIGANVGLIFLPVARALADGGRAVAVEPVPVNAERLRRSLALDPVPPGVSAAVVEAALGAEPGEITIVKEGGSDTSDNAVIAVGDEPGIRVRMSTLDLVADELGLTRLDTIKIDVEGFEVMVLRGAPGVIERFRPVVYGEFNNQLMPQRGGDFHAVWSLFEPLGYGCYSFAADLTLDPREAPPADLGNVILVPHEKVDRLAANGVRFLRRD